MPRTTSPAGGPSLLRGRSRAFARQARSIGNKRHLFVAGAAAAALLATAAPAQSAPFAYVTNNGGDSISQFNVGAGGLLAPLSPPTVAAGNAAKVAVSPNGRSVYVVNSGFAGTVSQYDVGADGKLSPKSPARVAAGTYPYGVAVSPDGKSVYVTLTDPDFSQGGVSQYDAGPGGALSPKSPATVPAGGSPGAVAVHPDGESVYVTNFVSDNVSQYDVGADGKLSPKSPATVATGSGPNAVALHPNGQSAYVATRYGFHQVFQYNIGADGRLSPKSPVQVAAGFSPDGVAVSPNGKSVYVSNLTQDFRSRSSISQYDVGPGGRLSPKSPAQVAAGLGPSAVAVTPDGRSVYVANQQSDTVSQYNVSAGGRLSPKSPARVPTGSDPVGIAVTPPIPGWEARVTNRASGCTAQVQAPYLDGNLRVTAYTRVTCPNATQLTVKSRLRAAYPGFNDQTVAANGCLGGSGCVRTLPKGTTYFRLSCPRSQTRRNNQPYYTDITFYPGTNSNATSKSRSRTKTLSPFCVY